MSKELKDHEYSVHDKVHINTHPELRPYASIPGTVVKAGPKSVEIQLDNFKLSKDSPKPKMGGDTGIEVVNQKDLKYDVERNIEGVVLKFRRRKNGKYTAVGDHDADKNNPQGSKARTLSHGWKAFHNFNIR